VQNLLGQFESALGQAKFDHKAVLSDVNEFLQLRLKTKLLDKQYSREIVDCVLGAGDPLTNVSGLATRLTALNWLVNDKGGTSIVRMGVRVGNILKADSPAIVHEDKLSEVPEKELWQAFKSGVETPWNKSQTNFRTPATQMEYEEMLGLLGTLTGPVENFFEKSLSMTRIKIKETIAMPFLKTLICISKHLVISLNCSPSLTEPVK
jgi:glycyl-tRNA synthetase beta subunit